jgi:hypothetical protein
MLCALFYRVDGDRSPEGDHHMNGDKDGAGEAQEGMFCLHINSQSVKKHGTKKCENLALNSSPNLHIYKCPAFLLSSLLPHFSLFPLLFDINCQLKIQ